MIMCVVTRVDIYDFTVCVIKFCLPNHTKQNKENTGKLTPFDKTNIILMNVWIFGEPNQYYKNGPEQNVEFIGQRVLIQ